MVRRRLILVLAAALGAACEPQADMADSAAPDADALHEALADPAARSALLDSMPGGEMAVGDSAAEADLMREKMP